MGKAAKKTVSLKNETPAGIRNISEMLKAGGEAMIHWLLVVLFTASVTIQCDSSRLEKLGWLSLPKKGNGTYKNTTIIVVLQCSGSGQSAPHMLMMQIQSHLLKFREN